MNYLIDTNVISELKRKRPEPSVLAWVSERPAASLYLSVISLGEIRKGVESVTDIRKKSQLLDWLESDLHNFFADRILPIDATTADRWGVLLANAKRPIPAIDSLLAATASAHNLTFVTRNTKDLQGLEIALLNPWLNG